MADDVQTSEPLPPVDPGPRGLAPAQARQRRRWPWVGALVVLIGAIVYLVGWSGLVFPPAVPPVTVELTVGIQPAGSTEPLLVQDPGAVPVRAGAGMSLQVNYNQPMYTYLLWLDSQGQVVPLYPWNNEHLEVVDANQPPPERRAAKILLSPSTISGGWKFGPRGGLETVVLLARSTPLGQETQFGTLLGSLPPTRMRLPRELAVLALDGEGDSVSPLLSRDRGTEEEARAVDQPLLARLGRLRDQFELIRVVRFAHEGE